jgi:hypothetical protein
VAAAGKRKRRESWVVASMATAWGREVRRLDGVGFGEGGGEGFK